MSGYSVISFPALGLELDPVRSFSLGLLTIHIYGILIAAALLTAARYGMAHAGRAGLREDDVLDGVLWITPFAILCARIYYCIFSWDSYRSDPLSVLYLWEGGLAIFGGVIGAVLGMVVFCRIRRYSLPALLDLVLTSFLIGQGIGRWGNFFNREAFGGETEFFLRMGLQNPISGDVIYVHPTFLYESAWNLLGFLLIHLFYPRRRYDGQVALCYCAWYGLGRAVIEGLRSDSLYLGGIRVSQLLAIVICLCGSVLLLLGRSRPHDIRQLREHTAAADREAGARG